MNINFATQPLEYDPRLARFSEKPTDKPPVEVKTPTANDQPVKPENREPLQIVLAEHDISLNFRRDERSGQLIVEMIDNKTGDALRQLPSEVSLRLSEAFAKIQGQFIEARV